MRLKFIPPQLPMLHDKPPPGEGWSHEVKFDGYRSQLIIDEDGTRIYTRRGLDWTSKYRDLAAAAASLNVENAIVDGEIIVLNDAGLPDFAALRKAITRRQHDLFSKRLDSEYRSGDSNAWWKIKCYQTEENPGIHSFSSNRHGWLIMRFRILFAEACFRAPHARPPIS